MWCVFIFFGFCHLAVLDSLFSMQRQLNERPDALCCAELHQKSSAVIRIFLYSNVDNPTLTCNRPWNHSKKTDQAAHSQQEVQMRRLECAAKFWIAQTRKLMMAFWISVTLAYSGILWHTLATLKTSGRQ